MSVVLEMISRGWDNFLARPNGPLNLRFYVQPTMAGLLALRAGIQDAREGRQGYLWAMITSPGRRLQLLHEGWRGAMTPFLAAIALDSAYQLMTVRFIYPLELILYRDRARARPLRLIARTLQSPRAPVSAGCPTAAGITRPRQ